MIFLKLGGSLITDKSQPGTPRLEVLARLAQEIAQARSERPTSRLLLGHGSGSFGHPQALRYGTHTGAHTPQDWIGFQQVWWAAHRLHWLVLDALTEAEVPAISLPPSASAICENGTIVELAAEPVSRSLDAGLVPVVLGDVAYDRRRGSSIVSTEQVMAYLAGALRPRRILLAGLEDGVYASYPQKDRLLTELRSADLEGLSIGDSGETDVTGGMLDKVRWSLSLAEAEGGPQEVRIFSGATPGNVRRALLGEALGTRIKS